MKNPLLTLPDPEELQKFQIYCGGAGKQRKYGVGEYEGEILNLSGNRFLKIQGGFIKLPSNTTEAFTREAIMVSVELEEEAFQSQRDARVIAALPNGSKTIFRTKYIKYGNHNAMWEVLSSQLYGLTGLLAPDNRFLVYGARENGVPEILVASPVITGYSDLGDFLIHNNVLRFIDQKDAQKWQDLKSKLEKINNKGKAGAITGADKMERIKLLGQIYEMMPNYFHQEIEKSYGASKFIANWDFANFTLSNVGCRFTLDREGKVIGFESAFVDFGNSGVIGFGGKYKEESLERANKEAKRQVDNSLDYDPQVEFTKEEKDLMKQALADLKSSDVDNQKLQNIEPDHIENDDPKIRKKATDIAILYLYRRLPTNNPFVDLEIRNLLFKAAHQIDALETKMAINPASQGLLTLSDLPRHGSFEPILGLSVAEKTNLFVDGGMFNNAAMGENGEVRYGISRNPKLYRDSEIEMAFRLSLIPDAAIERMAQKWFLAEKFPNVFKVSKEKESEVTKDPKYNSAKEIAQIFKQRRDALVKSIPKQIVDDWVAQNAIKALSAQLEVKLAILNKTHIFNRDFDFDTNESRAPNTLEPITINQENSFAQRVKNAEHKEANIGIKTIINEIEDYKESIQSADEQEKFVKIIKFIEENCGKWKKSLKIEPSCSLFNIGLLRQNYKYRNPDFSEGKILSVADLGIRNGNIHSMNKFIVAEFVGNLKQTQITPSQKMRRNSEPLPLQQKLAQCI